MVSVITVTYNDPEGLRKTADSLAPLLGDLALQWEHIVVDSSPAKNQFVLESLAVGWPLIRVETQPKGIYPAMNAGLRVATGNLVWFLNGGDELSDKKVLLRMVEEFRRDRTIDLVCAQAKLYRQGKFHRYHKPLSKNLAVNLLGFNRLCHQALVYRSHVFRRVGEFSLAYQLAGDYEHLLRCYSAGIKMKTIRGALVEYDTGGQSSNVKVVLEEFHEAQKNLSPRFPLYFRLATELVRPLEELRIKAIKRWAV